MNRTVLAAALLLLAGPALAQDRRTVEVTADTLNVRATPWGTIITTARKGTLLVTRGERDGFVEVDWSGRTAWVSAEHVAAATAAAVEVTAQDLQVRAGPSTDAAVLGTAREGQAFARLGAQDPWVRVQFGPRAGWVHGEHVRPLGAAAPPPPPPPGSGWQGLHRGLTLDGAQVPRRGLENRTLRSALGVLVEPYGEAVQHEGRAFARGRISWFGGASDTGVTATETGAITGERLRALNTPLEPSAATLAARPADFYYAAMRFDYSPRDRAWWARARLLVVDPDTGRAVVVRCVDWGPHTDTRRVIDLSPQVMRDLGVATDANLLVSFAAPDAPLGVVR